MNDKLRTLLNNRHTTYAALLIGVCQILAIWFPDFKMQLDATGNFILVYALLFAGDAKPVTTPTNYNEEEKTAHIPNCPRVGNGG